MKVYHDSKRCEVFQANGKYTCSSCWQEFSRQPGPESGVVYVPDKDEKTLLIFTNGQNEVSRLLSHGQAAKLSKIMIPTALSGGWTWGYMMDARTASLGVKFTREERRRLHLDELVWVD